MIDPQTGNQQQPWEPSAKLQALRFRAAMLQRVRMFFDRLGFIEVQTPCLLDQTVVDAHLEPLTVDPHSSNPHSSHSQSGGDRLYLQTSPEAAMKRLLAAGAEAIYQLGPVFRADETGRFHNLEFTMLEWYRRGDDMQAGIKLLCDLVEHCVPDLQIPQITYRSLFIQHLGIDPIECSLEILRSTVQQHEPTWLIDAPVGVSAIDPGQAAIERDALLDVLMGLVLQPKLRGAVVVTNYPVSQAALAKRSQSDPATAERFELYVDGIELANGYAELCDADELLRRTEDSNVRRVARGVERLPAPSRLLAAMRHGFPECSGTALGFDRLVMVAGGFADIRQVLAFPRCQ